MRVATLNVWGLPWPISREGSARMQAIGARLPALELDWMAFQEVWTGSARAQLIEAGRRAGLVHAWHRGAALGGSGLLVLSRAPFASAHFEAYTLRGFPERIWHADYHGGKGFCALRFPAAGGSVTLIDTHLHAQYGDDAYDDEHPHRLAQAVQIAAAIAAIRDPVVAAGDFNMSEGRREYAVFTGLSGMRDAAALLDHRQPTTLGTNPYRDERPPHDHERIDYVFARDGDGARLRVRSIERIFDEPPAGGPAAYSDHAGLIAEIELVPDAASRAPAPEAAAAELAGRVLAEGREAALARRGAQRLSAAGALGVAAVAVAGARQPLLSRRRVLRAGLGAGALVALPFGLSNAALAEIAIPDEVRAFDAVREQLAALQARVAPPPG
ncbi:MAG TPA: endonuclease/exonuclease/phosphatase family protein [Myxococcota bacterium]|jgi:endonuclease/exonuclease/phosphatase family metal-dependent hydrolase